MGGTVACAEIRHARGIPPLIGPDGYLHRLDTTALAPDSVRRSGATHRHQAELVGVGEPLHVNVGCMASIGG
jgi:hypothetical protein